MLNKRLRLRDGSCMNASNSGNPKKDGSGRGVRGNRGRGGCRTTRNNGKGRNR